MVTKIWVSSYLCESSDVSHDSDSSDSSECSDQKYFFFHWQTFFTKKVLNFFFSPINFFFCQKINFKKLICSQKKLFSPKKFVHNFFLPKKNLLHQITFFPKKNFSKLDTSKNDEMYSGQRLAIWQFSFRSGIVGHYCPNLQIVLI